MTSTIQSSKSAELSAEGVRIASAVPHCVTAVTIDRSLITALHKPQPMISARRRRIFIRGLSDRPFRDRPLNEPNPRRSLMPYVDGFVIPVSKDKIEAYKAQARKAGEVWMEHGALAFVECIGDDVPLGEVTSFPRAVQAKDDEIVVFSWIVYRNRAERDAIDAKVMADPRLKEDMPFDGKRLIFGGFEMWLQM
jgi:uncharacterized protein YbaA (DUF1428 family)